MEVQINSRRFGVKSRVSDQGLELWSEIKGFRNKDWRVGIIEYILKAEVIRSRCFI